ncbi:hypothetical protein RchiOBHm_Chr2g0126581 [Rosa chinensis]|uniref:Retrotransposon Copia-like N-terminal domain-containing protein n=1 Tax=Rosa chinensis TaxID=74649 RepID=A0A2P6RTV2_ROSCH|nr:hypothetical protein RchiOBHm_Chr2g0126581 [Rosa chinensis]
MSSTPSPSPNITQIVLSLEQSSQLINPSLSPHQLTNVIPVKLSKDNYLTWKSLLIPILQTYACWALLKALMFVHHLPYPTPPL